VKEVPEALEGAPDAAQAEGADAVELDGTGIVEVPHATSPA